MALSQWVPMGLPYIPRDTKYKNAIIRFSVTHFWPVQCPSGFNIAASAGIAVVVLAMLRTTSVLRPLDVLARSWSTFRASRPKADPGWSRYQDTYVNSASHVHPSPARPACQQNIRTLQLLISKFPQINASCTQTLTCTTVKEPVCNCETMQESVFSTPSHSLFWKRTDSDWVGERT